MSSIISPEFQSQFPEFYKDNRLRCFVIMLLGCMSYVHWITLFPVLSAVIVWAVAGNLPCIVALIFYITELSVVGIGFGASRMLPLRYVAIAPIMMLIHTPLRSLAAGRILIDLARCKAMTRHKTRHATRADPR